MAPIDDLPADQRAVLRLLLEQGRSYDEIARALQMAPAGVRDRAHAALAELGPALAGRDAAHRGELADWLLGQQDPQQAERTRRTLLSSDAGRAWAQSVADELRPLTASGLPEIPSPAARSAASDGRITGRRVSRRGGRLLLGGAALLVALGSGFLLGRATGGGDEPAQRTTTQSAQTATVVGQATLTPPAKAPAKGALGLAQFAERAGQRLINVVAEGLPSAPQGDGYGVWLTGAGREPLWLGYFQAATTSGQVGAQSSVPVDPGLYRSVLITRERGSEPKSPGTVYLSGPVQIR
ncbi:MAG: hypothetical protein LT070_03395 [Solirubrobacteraceae bacterium]|nr:hypothetical protein [Solirubrobacteraceae bacterium]